MAGPDFAFPCQRLVCANCRFPIAAVEVGAGEWRRAAALRSSATAILFVGIAAISDLANGDKLVLPCEFSVLDRMWPRYVGRLR